MGTIESYEDKGKEHLLSTTTCQGQHKELYVHYLIIIAIILFLQLMKLRLDNLFRFIRLVRGGARAQYPHLTAKPMCVPIAL